MRYYTYTLKEMHDSHALELWEDEREWLSMYQSRSEDQPSLQKGESLEGKTSFLREESLRLEFQIDVWFERDLLVSPGEPWTCREQGQSLASYFIPLSVA